jgi:hypothetical protein
VLPELLDHAIEIRIAIMLRPEPVPRRARKSSRRQRFYTMVDENRRSVERTLELAVGQGRQTNIPSKDETGLDASNDSRSFLRGAERSFFLDILFHRMSNIAIFQ